MLQLSHDPRPRPIKRARFGRLVKAGFFAFGMPEGSFCSIDVTHRCNLRCQHCYFMQQGYENELAVEEWLTIWRRLKKEAWPRPYIAFQCSWVGGEPLLRKEVIEQGKRFFPYNIVVTNGSLPLPSWPDVHFFVSVDGTREAHDAIRGKGSYAKIIQHTHRDDLDLMLTYCINKQNKHCIEPFMIEWDKTPVRHVAFELHTPIAGLPANNDLTLDDKERDQVLDLLLALKEVYGHFILPPARTYRLMRSQVSRKITDRCLYREIALVLGPDGQRKRPCMLGPKADCDRCGCLIPFVTRAQVDRKEVLLDLWNGFSRRFGKSMNEDP